MQQLTGIVITLLLSSCLTYGQALTGGPHDIYLLGNSVQIEDPRDYGEAIQKLLAQSQNEWTIVFTGDVIDPDKGFSDEMMRFDHLIRNIPRGEKGQIVLIPGDREWAAGSAHGLNLLKKFETTIKEQSYDQVYYPLRKGCPGPYFFPATENLKLLLLNTQWINHPHDKPTSESAVCELANIPAFLEEIESYIEDNGQENMMIIGHHPLISHSKVGGFFPLSDWILPFPPLSLFLTAHRQNIGGSQDIINRHFDDFRHKLNDVLADFRSLIYTSGHAQNIELFRRDDNIYLNSGALLQGDFVKRTKQTLFAGKDPGIVQVRYHPNGQVDAKVHAFMDSAFVEVHETMLFQPPCKEPIHNIPINHRLVPCLDETLDPIPDISHPKQITLAANPGFKMGKGGTRFLGQHYRTSWTTPIRVDVLNLDTFAGGLFPTEIGGGRQTKSLKFKSKERLDFVFRSVDKDPSKALSRDLRSTILSIVVGDQTTTQQPYGALVASKLLDRLDILHARPQLFIMPNDQKLGHFGREFSGMMGLLEERPTDPGKSKGFAGADDIKRSLKLFRRMYIDRDNLIELNEFVRARVFDILVGDWGKHEDNWKWAGFKKEKGLLYRPIPRDRDHVFSRWDGLLPWLADREWAKPSGENFDIEIKGLRSLMWQARHLDRFLASEAGREQWLHEARFIQNQISAVDIESAVGTLPPEIRDPDGHEIETKLKQRIDDLDDYALEYYDILAKEVDVVGSNKHESFELERMPDGKVEVKMYKLRKGVKDELYYQRIFNPDETKEIRLFGMDGNDQFDLSGIAKSSILVRLIPGAGLDTIQDRSSVKGGRRYTLLYDKSGDVVSAGNELRYATSRDPSAYRYQRTAFAYNTYFPLLYLVTSSDYGLSVNANVTFTNQRYGKPDFSSIHSFASRISTIGNFRIAYEGSWRHILGSLDLIGGLSYENKRRYRFFFGVGNDTSFDSELLREDYYTLQYANLKGFLGLQQSFWKRSKVSISGLIETNSRQSSTNTIMQSLELLGEEQLTIFKANMLVDLDFRDRKNLPTRGVRLVTTNQLGLLLDGRGSTYPVGESRLEYFTSLMPLTLGLRVGAMYTDGDVPYYDLPTIGQNRYLRGYRRNRFVGDRATYFNTELRCQLIDKLHTIIPYKLGARVFYDQARVSVAGETSKKWHRGYGAGLYFVPLRERFSLHLTVGFSEEESGLILFGFGNSF